MKKSNIYDIPIEREDFINKEQSMVERQIAVVGMASKEDIEIFKQQRKERLKHLKNLGLIVRNRGMSVYLNKLSPGCIHCCKGISLSVAATTECNRKCFYWCW